MDLGHTRFAGKEHWWPFHTRPSLIADEVPAIDFPKGAEYADALVGSCRNRRGDVFIWLYAEGGDRSSRGSHGGRESELDRVRRQRIHVWLRTGVRSRGTLAAFCAEGLQSHGRLTE